MFLAADVASVNSCGFTEVIHRISGLELFTPLFSQTQPLRLYVCARRIRVLPAERHASIFTFVCVCVCV